MAKRENAAEPKWNEERQQWQMQVQKQGARKQFSSAKPGKAGSSECLRKYNRWLAGDQKYSDPRLREVWPDYLEDIAQRKGIESKTYQDAASCGRLRILPALGAKKVGKITEQDFQKLINQAKPISGSGMLSRKTIMNIRGEISLLCKFLKKSGYMEWRPDSLEIPKKFQFRQDKQILQRDEISMILKDNTPDVYLMAWQMMLTYGFRPGEVYGLQWKDVTGSRITISRAINDQRQITPGKNKNARRSEYLTEYAKDLLDRARKYQISRNQISIWIFANKNGDPLNGQNSNHKLHEYCKANQITDISPYRLRHTFASLAKNALSEAQLKLTLGHAASMDTGIYIHELEQDQIDTGVALNNLFRELLK